MSFMQQRYGVAMTISSRGESQSFVPPERDREFVAGRTVAEIGTRLLDDAYSTWLVAEGEAGEALRGWLGAAGRSREDAYYVYLAAIDREHAAAYDLQRLQEIAAPAARGDVAVAPLG
jgi:hypothetical protein